MGLRGWYLLNQAVVVWLIDDCVDTSVGGLRLGLGGWYLLSQVVIAWLIDDCVDLAWAILREKGGREGMEPDARSAGSSMRVWATRRFKSVSRWSSLSVDYKK